MLGERERQHLAVALDQVTRRTERRCDRVVGARTSDDELQREQLVEREPTARLLGLRLGLGKVDRRDRVAAQRQLELRGQRVGKEASVLRERRPRELAEAGRGHALARRVDRGEVRRRPRGADVVALHVEAVAAEPAAQPQLGARRKLVGQPRLVEPRRADRAGVVLDPSGHDRAPAADPARAHIDDFARDRDLVVAPELRDRDLVDRALVAAGAMEQQVADRDDAERPQVAGERRPDAGKRRDRQRVELFGRLKPAWPRPLVLDHTCETRVHSGQGCHRDRA